MGLLEKAGKIKDDDKPKKAAKKAKKADAVLEPAKKVKEKPAKKAKAARQPRERKAREPRVMPDDYKLAGKAGIFARKLVDIIVSYAGIVGLIAYTATGAFFNPNDLAVFSESSLMDLCSLLTVFCLLLLLEFGGSPML